MSELPHDHVSPDDRLAGFQGWLGGLVALSGLLILVSARGDLWLDEIWSLAFARAVRSAGEILLLRHDNNHPLNTLFLFLLRRQEAPLAFRALSMASGIGSLLLIAHLALRKWGRAEALLAVALAGTSFPLMLYFSEARGYAPAILCALGACAASLAHAEAPEWKPRLAYWLLSCLGVLAHATFVLVPLSLLAVDLVAWARRPLPAGVRRLAALHGPPLAAFAGWYAFFLRRMELGGGPVLSRWDVVGQVCAWLFGLEGLPHGHGLSILLACLVLLAGTLCLRREGDPAWAFFPAALLVLPAAMVAAARPEYLYFRYFIVCFPFFHLLLARLACVLFRRAPARWRWAVPLGIAGILAAQAPHLAALVRSGRGSYSAALEAIGAGSPQGQGGVGSDHDFRNGVLVDFYARRIPGGDRLTYVPASSWQVRPPDWFLLHSQDPAFHPPRRIGVAGAGTFRFAVAYPFSGVSGWSWAVYRREP
ncbi:MAG TPA: hypothetical protein VN436_17385 [Holophaga sp.]|nr:hypothetical protein [Holophaga sp.]